MIHACHAGCDFSRHWLDLSSLSPLAIPVAAPVAAGRFANDAAGRQALLRRLTEAGPNQSGPDQSGPDQSGVALLVIEASGGTEQGLLIAAWAAGQKVALVPAQRVRHFARSLGQQARTDRIDAHVLALYAARTGPAPTPATGENHRRLRTLVARRRNLVGMRADERKRGLHCGTDSVARSITALDTGLSAEIKTIEAAIRAAIQTCRDRAARAARRLGMPGIGPATAATLLAELPELGQVSQVQVSQGQVSQGPGHLRPDRGPRRPRHLHPAKRPMARQKLDVGRQKAGPRRPLHGRNHLRLPNPIQVRHILQIPARQRQTPQTRPDRHNAKNAHNPQRNAPK